MQKKFIACKEAEKHAQQNGTTKIKKETPLGISFY